MSICGFVSFHGAAFVASHLSVISNSMPTIGAGKSSGTAEETGLPGAFAALLGSSDRKTDSPAPTRNPAAPQAEPAETSARSGREDKEPEAVAAIVETILPPQIPEEAKPLLVGIIDDLATLQASIEAGTPVDPELLQRLDASLSDFAELLGIDLNEVPTLDALRLMTAEALPENADFAATLARALQPVALSLEEGAVDAGPEFADLVKSTGDKLAALLQALNSDEIAPEMLAQLQPDGDAPVDEQLQAALARLTQTPIAEEAGSPRLGAAELALTEPVLTGKANAEARPPDDPHPETDPARPSQKLGEPVEARPEPAQKDRPVPDARAAAAPAADTDAPDPQVGTQPAQVARADVIAPRVMQAGYQTSQQQLNLPQLAFEIVRQVSEGNTRFQIRLDPPELGRIDVKLDIDAGGRINARLTVEKAETLDLMQRDQRALERALQQAGLDGNKTNLEFSLRQNPFGGGQQGRDGDERLPLFAEEASGEAEDSAPPLVNLYRGNLSASGVNIIA